MKMERHRDKKSIVISKEAIKCLNQLVDHRVLSTTARSLWKGKFLSKCIVVVTMHNRLRRVFTTHAQVVPLPFNLVTLGSVCAGIPARG